MIVAVLGPDHFLSRQALEQLLVERNSDDFNTSHFHSAETSNTELVAAVSAPPFMGNHRIVVVSGLFGKARSESSKNRTDEIRQLLQQVPDSTVLIGFDPDASSIPAVITRGLAQSIARQTHATPRGQGLIDLTCELAEQRASSIDRPAARHLLDRLFPGHWQSAPRNPAFDNPPRIDLLDSEIEKLSLACHPDEISVTVINELSPSSVEETTFPLLDAIVAGDGRQALLHLVGIAQDSETASRLYAMTCQQVEGTLAATAAGRPRDPVEAGKALKMPNPNRMKMMSRSVEGSRISQDALLMLVTETDRKLKSSQVGSTSDALHRIASRLV